MIHLLAQVDLVTAIVQPLVASSPIGVVLAWFMLRHDSRLADIAHRIDGLTRAMLMDMVARDNLGDSAKKHANEMLAKIEARTKR